MFVLGAQGRVYFHAKEKHLFKCRVKLSNGGKEMP